MQHKNQTLPVEIILQIAQFDLATASTHNRGLCWCLVSPFLYKDSWFRHMLDQQWILLDIRKGAPYFRMHAAISGNTEVFRTASHAWDGLDANLPLPSLTSTEADIRPSEPYAMLLGQQFAYNAALLQTTAVRGTLNQHITVESPAFRHKSDADVYLDCLRYQYADNSILEPRFLDLLFILSREDGPSFPVREGSDPQHSPAFMLINMFLESFPNKWPFLSDQLRSSWKLICGGPIHVTSPPVSSSVSGTTKPLQRPPR